jgi:plasmid stabilization system protein ParE
MEYFYHPAAVAEYGKAVEYYKEISAAIARQFVQNVERAVSLIVDQPNACTKISRNVRRCIIANFPYSIFYSEFEKRIIIVAVAHQKHRPNYWKRRKP